MAHVQPLFELQSSAPGMPGPYIVENLACYHVLDKIGQKKPRTMLVLGGACKRQHISSAYSLYGYPKVHSVGIADVGDNTLALDGELHLQKHDQLPRFQEKRPFGGGCHAHILEQGFSREGSIAHQLYANVLSPLSDIILIFVPDFGLDIAIEMLCSWMRSAMGAGFHIASRVLLLHDSIPAEFEIKNRLLASFASKLRKSDPLRSYTSADTQSIIENAFHMTSVSLDDCTWRAQVEAELNAARAHRKQEGMDFTAHQMKYLLRAAIRQYAQDPLAPLDIIRSLKQQHAPDSNYSDAIRDFLQIHQPISDIEASIVASALNLDAHPPGTPWFPPERIFQSLYQGLIEDCGRCITAHATSGQSYRPQVKSCPLCQSPNSSPFFIKPPTASAIALNLRGTNPVKIIQFLKDLRRSVGFPLQDCFDIVIGSEAGKSTFGFSNMRANVS
ncbi:patatin-like serine hydrolase [Fusarium mundagurra]|uniref:Patatin-like serine hydrolase n=1 Tax=Fusarium mundagurra TaxID=1567541 RepID=A0A8H6DQ27_9HYPO|nr:patatin-like serine hydrolase [Fusarium mundagurra]